MRRPLPFLPRGLYGRAALILILPVVMVQLVVSVAFIQRHFDRVTQQMTRNLVLELRYVLAAVEAAPDLPAAQAQAGARAAAFGLALGLPDSGPVPQKAPEITRAFYDLSGKAAAGVLSESLPALLAADFASDSARVTLRLASSKGPLTLSLERRRLSPSNPHQLLVLMAGTGILMTFIAYLFLRNQLRPIAKLARAAEAFGKGAHLPYRPGGASEVRAAGRAFLDMRGRIERQMEQRTLMLSGVSHDLRTPLTRMRLGLSLLPEGEETAALLSDVGDMERLVDEFLAFARDEALEETALADPAALARAAVGRAERLGRPVALGPLAEGLSLALRPVAVARALDNLIANALRYGQRAQISLSAAPDSITFWVEDDGPGIAAADRAAALQPFVRLDAARDPNRGSGGAGLGLAIAADIARAHGGALTLGQSAGLGGLAAALRLARAPLLAEGATSAGP